MTSGEVAMKKGLEVQETQKKVTTAVMTGIESTFAGAFNKELNKLPMKLSESVCITRSRLFVFALCFESSIF
jgi:hypothetical protein